MTSALEQIISLATDGLKTQEVLEARLNFMMDGFRRLFEEEDIRDLPSYQLLRLSYADYLEKPGSIKQTAEVKRGGALYDPLFMPPSMRRGARKSPAPLAPPPPAPLAPVPAPAEPDDKGATDFPDFTQNLLDDVKKPAKKVAIKAKPKTEVHPQVVADGHVFQIELRGTIYYLHGFMLYDKGTRQRVGHITQDGYTVHGQFLPCTWGEVIALKELADGALLGPDDKVYARISEGLAQSIGIYKDGEINAWA